jgi:DNA-binding MurR/RpiR family transcriptional regulator
LGYSGFYQLKINLASENGPIDTGNPGYAENLRDVRDLINYTTALMAGSVKNISMETINSCLDLLARASMVYITAWGNTGAVAMDFSHRLRRCGKRTLTSQDADSFLEALYLSGPEDVLVTVSHSGTSLHIIQSMEVARQRNMKCILITNSADSQAGGMADYVLSAEVESSLFGYYGGESHLFEMMLVDIIIYFFSSRYPELRAEVDGAEVLLSQYKL